MTTTNTANTDPQSGGTPVCCGEEMRYNQLFHGYECRVCGKDYGEL